MGWKHTIHNPAYYTKLLRSKTSANFATYYIPKTTRYHNRNARLDYFELLESNGLKVVSATNSEFEVLRIDVRWNYEGSRYQNVDQLPSSLQLPEPDEA